MTDLATLCNSAKLNTCEPEIAIITLHRYYTNFDDTLRSFAAYKTLLYSQQCCGVVLLKHFFFLPLLLPNKNWELKCKETNGQGNDQICVQNCNSTVTPKSGSKILGRACSGKTLCQLISAPPNWGTTKRRSTSAGVRELLSVCRRFLELPGEMGSLIFQKAHIAQE